MTVAERLRQLVACLPDGARVELPVSEIRQWLASEREAPAVVNGGPDRMLAARDVADRLGIDLDSVYQLAPSWPWAYKVSARRWRFSERGLDVWLRRQQG